ncbi:MAG: two-component system, OmpR family, phosphate regulon response regulator PhoB [Gaiellaceae bacterium]|jgi:DNA-binding response OmpR family regulator|nr:two-component system, OmpR family, phosphate regulon response regulator PhoB [Gaiellaceae bacterium]
MTASRPRILVVDDEPPLRELVVVTLGDAFVCDEADDGDEALVRLGEAQYDLVMLDVMMPGTSGTDVLRQMRSDDALRDVPVIVMSAWQSPQDVASALEAGADRFLAKPFRIDELGSMVRGLVGRST